MAAAAFWNIFELRKNVFSYLDEDACIADLARCARVHSTWTDSALDVLYRGDTMPKISTENLRLELGRNTRMTSAIARLPPARRQKYASRACLLDLSMFNHWPLYCRMFNGFQLPRLKGLVVNSEGPLDQYLTEEKEKEDSNWTWLPSTLEYILICDEARYQPPSLLTGSFLNDIANNCPGLKQVWFKTPSFGLDPADLARFFRRIQPRELRLDLGSKINDVLTYDVLSALSSGGRLETLIIRRARFDGLMSGYSLGQLYKKHTPAELFASLHFLDISFSCEAILWALRCFSTVTSLRLELPGTVDERILVPISTMTQLRVLEFRRDDNGVEPIMPARAFVVLASLSRLNTLRISGSFKPCYVPGGSYPCVGPVTATATGLVPMTQEVDPDEEDEELHYPGDWFTESDAAEMFSGLTSLEELSVDAGGHWFPDFLLQTISEICPNLKIIEFRDKISLRQFVGPEAPLFENLREMRVEHVKSDGTSAGQMVGILSEVAPKLQTLVNLRDGYRHGGFGNDVLTAFDESRKSERSSQSRAL